MAHKNINRIKRNTVQRQNKSFNQNSFSVVELNAYDKPIIKEENHKKWVDFTYGESNNKSYYKRLIDLSLSSPTNGRCIRGISDMIFGRGLEATDSKDKPLQFAMVKEILKKKQLKRIVDDFKLLGQASCQIIYNKTKTKILTIKHFPTECLKPEKANKGVIEAYYYHPDWDNYKPNDKVKRIPTFGNGRKSEGVEIFMFKPYRAGMYYYSIPEYHSCLQYAELETEVSNYHVSNVKNSLQPTLFINFNNGVPNEETRNLIEHKVNEKFSGTSNSGKAMLGFNDSKEEETTIKPIHLPDAHAQYQFLSDEGREKIMLGHGIVSPILLGIKDNTGFGNNAEELRTASVIMDNIVIRPLQQVILDGLKEIFEYNLIDLNLYFITLQPIEFTELDNISTKVRKEEETGEKLSAEEIVDFTDEEGDDLLNQLEGLGEIIDDDWEIIHSEEATGDDFDVTKLSKSSQDSGIYKIRYAYMDVRNSIHSRRFCKGMEALTKKGVVYRKEDINQMSFRGVNKEFGHKRRNYSLMLYKGGVNCKHYWELRVYGKKNKRISIQDAKKDGAVIPNNPKEVGMRPFDILNRWSLK